MSESKGYYKVPQLNPDDTKDTQTWLSNCESYLATNGCQHVLDRYRASMKMGKDTVHNEAMRQFF